MSPHSIKNKCLYRVPSPYMTRGVDSLLRLKILVPTKLIIHLSRFKLICIISNLNVFSTFVSISGFLSFTFYIKRKIEYSSLFCVFILVVVIQIMINFHFYYFIFSSDCSFVEVNVYQQYF